MVASGASLKDRTLPVESAGMSVAIKVAWRVKQERR